MNNFGNVLILKIQLVFQEYDQGWRRMRSGDRGQQGIRWNLGMCFRQQFLCRLEIGRNSH